MLKAEYLPVILADFTPLCSNVSLSIITVQCTVVETIWNTEIKKWQEKASLYTVYCCTKSEDQFGDL